MSKEYCESLLLLNFGELSRGLFKKLKRFDDRLDDRDRDVIDSIIATIYDEQITSGMHWTRIKYTNYQDHISRVKSLCRRHPDPKGLILDVVGSVQEDLDEHLDLPTWKIITVSRKDTFLYLEVGEDFRINQWRDEHADEYPEATTKGW